MVVNQHIFFSFLLILHELLIRGENYLILQFVGHARAALSSRLKGLWTGATSAVLFLGARQVYVRSFCYIAPVTANLSPTAQLEGWLPPPTPASGRSLLQVPAARVKINQHPPASCEQEKISPEEGALGHLPSDEEGRPLYQAVIIA